MTPPRKEKRGIRPGAIDEAKRSLRETVRARLRALAPLTKSQALEVQERLLASGLLDKFSSIALYRALPSEPPAELLEENLRARGVRVALPCLAEIDRAEIDRAGKISTAPRPLEFREAGGTLRKSPLGFHQPNDDSHAIPLAEIEAFIIPMLAADRHGNRLGRGGGHYDATLAANPSAFRIGLLREAALLENVPAGEHDQPLDALATESQIIICRNR